MKAKSDNLRATKPKRYVVLRRLPYDERRAQILDKAVQFFSEYGLTGQTRHLAAACGVSQRLLYRYFRDKAALLDEVYREAIAKPFDDAWLDELGAADRPLRERLLAFYARYTEEVLTRRWLPLFLYSSLAEYPMASAYTDLVVKRVLEDVVAIAVRDMGLRPFADAEAGLRVGWVLHGSIVLGGIRTHVYRISDADAWHREIEVAVDAFLTALPVLVENADSLPPVAIAAA